MNDMMRAIEPKSDQINADDLIGGDIVITVTGVKVSPGEDQPVSIHFHGSPKAFRPCKTMSRVLVAVWGADASKYTGRSLKLYRDPDVTWGGLKVGGIRIREMSDMEGNRPMTLALTEKRGSRKPAVIKPLTVEPQAPTAPAEPTVPERIGLARAAAMQGTEAFRKWWNSDEGKASRAAVSPIMVDLRAMSADADAAMSDDPFGLPPLPEADSPSPEDIARSEAAALAAIRARDAEAAP